MSLDIIAIIIAILVPLLGYFLIVDRRITRLETKMDPFWRIIEKKLPELLHSPDPAHAEMDRLLEKFMDKSISNGEMEQLHQMMAEQMEKVNPGKQVQYMLMMAKIEQIMEEKTRFRWKNLIGLS